MLPDYPKLKADIWRLLKSRAEENARQSHKLLFSIPKILQHEGDQNSYSTVDGKVEELAAQEHQALVEIPFADIATMTMEDAQKHITEAYDQLHDSITKRLLEVVEEAADSVGNVVDCKGSPLTPELYLEVMSRVSLDFDDPSGFCLVAHPSMEEKIKASFEQWGQDPEFVKKWQDLEARKRREWLDQESCRKLVD